MKEIDIKLKDMENYTHGLKTFLYGLPRQQILCLFNESKILDNEHGILKDAINMIANIRLFKPVEIQKPKKKDFYHLNFIDKGLDYINLSGILKSKMVKDKIPVYFQNIEPPVIGFRFNRSIAGLLFNYKKCLQTENVERADIDNMQCNCSKSPFIDQDHNHVISGNLDIIENTELRNIVRKGPKYRLPRKIDWKKNVNNISNFLDTYIKDWIRKEQKENPKHRLKVNLLTPWKAKVLQLVQNRIDTCKKKCKRFFPLKISGKLKEELDTLQKKYILTPADKAQNNVIFICKKFYFSKIREELEGSNSYKLVNETADDINNNITLFSQDFGISIKDEMKEIPVIYFVPKMHKNPTKQRFIAGSKICSLKALSKHFSKCLKLILTHMKNYYNTVFQRTGVKHYWIIENSLEFLENISELKTSHLETYDFSTLYPSLPHDEIRTHLKIVFKTVFKRECKLYINVNYRKAYFTNIKVKGYIAFSEKDMNMVLNFILNNVFVKFGNKIYKQTLGIPIGLDSGQDIANLLLFQYESKYLETLSKTDIYKARQFKHCARYIDDLFSAKFTKFQDHLSEIYPASLVVNKSNSLENNVAYLDINIVSESNNLKFSVYDKRDDFSFEIVNYPYLDSCIPRKSALGVFVSQLIRYARICSTYKDFSERGLSLSHKLLQQGYKYESLRKMASRFFHSQQELIKKYNIRSVNIFFNDILRK